MTDKKETKKTETKKADKPLQMKQTAKKYVSAVNLKNNGVSYKIGDSIEISADDLYLITKGYVKEVK